MALVVPLTGLCASGSWRGAWRYTLGWLKYIAIFLVAGAVLALIFLPTPE